MKILLHDGHNNIIKGINKYLIQHLHGQHDNEILFSDFHTRLLGVYQTYLPKIVVWPASEYTQEVHDFITEYSNACKIILMIDVNVDHKELNDFWHRTPGLKTVVNSSITDHKYKNSIAEYTSLYDHQIFNEANTTTLRNNKIIALLSGNNDHNNILTSIVYPNNKYPIVAINNPDFDSLVNLGLVNYIDLNFVLNNFSKVIDIDRQYQLECSACNIEYLDIFSHNINDALDNNYLVPRISDLQNYTFDYFVKNYLLEHFKVK